MIISHTEAINRLNQFGFVISSVYDLLKTKKKYIDKIPVLIELLNYDFEEIKIKEGIVRALAIKEASGIANNALFKEYYRSIIDKDKKLYCWTIGNTICFIVKKNDFDNLVNIVKNPQYGISRQMFVMALGRIKSEQTEQVLIDLLDDSDVILHTINSLGRLKSHLAKDKLLSLALNKNKVISNEAIKALNNINKSNLN